MAPTPSKTRPAAPPLIVIVVLAAAGGATATAVASVISENRNGWRLSARSRDMRAVEHEATEQTTVTDLLAPSRRWGFVVALALCPDRGPRRALPPGASSGCS